MENRFIDNLTRILELELPECDTMDEYLDAILPRVLPWNEGFHEYGFVDVRWLEVKDDDAFHEAVLHIFQEDGEYLLSIDGNLLKGGWRALSSGNTLVLDVGGRSELYDCVFVNSDFFILKKHGDQQRKGYRKYFVLGREGAVSGLEWRDVMEALYNLYRGNTKFVIYLGIAIVLIALLAYLSFF